MIGQTVTRIRAGRTLDPYSGKPSGQPDWSPSAVSTLEVSGCLLAPITGEEALPEGLKLSKGWTMYCFMATPDITREDRVITPSGETYRVVEPQVWTDGEVLGGTVYYLEVIS